MPEQSNEQLIGRAVAGDRGAVSELLQASGPALRQYLSGQIGVKWRSVLEVEDVLQVTFLEAFLRIGSFDYRGPGSWEAWLHRMARNNLLDAVRALEAARQVPPERRVAIPSAAESSWALLECLGVTTGTPSRHAATDEEHLRLRQAVGQLPRDYCQVITLYDLEGRSAEEVCSTMGRSKGAIYMLRARALDFLRESMADGP